MDNLKKKNYVLMCDTKNFGYKLNKSILYKYANSTNHGYINNIGINKLDGILISSCDELNEAYKILNEKHSKLILKPCIESGGTGILTVDESNIANICLNYDKYILEEYVDNSYSICVHMYSNEMIGPITYEIVENNKYIGCYYIKNKMSIELSNNIISQTKVLSNHLGVIGFWGVDFIVKNNVAYLIDINLFRINGSHAAKIYIDKFRPNENFVRFLIKIADPENLLEYINFLTKYKDILILEISVDNNIVFLIIGDKCMEIYSKFNKYSSITIDILTQIINTK
jgi:hypothetical protein